jgi:hypothetical protein
LRQRLPGGGDRGQDFRVGRERGENLVGGQLEVNAQVAAAWPQQAGHKRSRRQGMGDFRPRVQGGPHGRFPDLYELLPRFPQLVD